MCNDFAFERSEDTCVGVGAGRLVEAGSGGMTEYHCDVGGKMNFGEDLVCVGFGSVTSASASVSLEPFFGGFLLLSEDLLPLGSDFSITRVAASSFILPSRFFLEGPAWRSSKNAETSAARFGYFNKLEDEKG